MHQTTILTAWDTQTIGTAVTDPVQVLDRFPDENHLCSRARDRGFGRISGLYLRLENSSDFNSYGPP